MIVRLIILLMTLVTVAEVRADSPASKALQERVRAHQELLRFNLEIHVQVSSESGSGEPTREFTASVQRDGSRMLRVFQQLTILSTERCTIIVDRSRSLILYSERRDANRDVQLPIRQDALAVLKSFTRRGPNTVVSQVDADTWFVEEPRRLPGQRVRLTFDHQSHLLKEVAYVPRTISPSAPSAVFIQYEWKDPAAFDVAQLSEERFVTRVGDRLEPASGFVGYHIRRVDAELTPGGR